MIRLDEMGRLKFTSQGVSRRPQRPYPDRRDPSPPPAAPPVANVDPGLLIAQVEHGPQLHGGIIPILLVIVLVAGLAYLILRGRKGSPRDPGSDGDAGSDRGPEA